MVAIYSSLGSGHPHWSFFPAVDHDSDQEEGLYRNKAIIIYLKLYVYIYVYVTLSRNEKYWGPGHVGGGQARCYVGTVTLGCSTIRVMHEVI